MVSEGGVVSPGELGGCGDEGGDGGAGAGGVGEGGAGGAAGGCTCVAGGCQVTVIDRVAVSLAASVAEMVMTFVPVFSGIARMSQLDEPTAPPEWPLSARQVTWTGTLPPEV